ncbi:factor-independent urate hydroxylase [Pseudonocardia sp. HH130630-07]|uniref:factor-independent urate hydroxylase n=1 Tax=Pseudonocardia sp. HH130630-07 TaxID=1690815 RepID=UPI0008153027|nr:urate oxidase [Pseudonocardia sp. HH130630-07]ANY08953.1 urate oxidase [Pseudonocardia sp. HH130630-07]
MPVLGHTQYGKAEVRVVRIYRDTDPHEIADHNVSVALSGQFADTHLTGDNTRVLTTDAIKNTVNAFAKEAGDAARTPEVFGRELARHFADVPQVERVRVGIETYPWRRLEHAGAPHPHAFARDGGHVRTTTVTRTTDGDEWVVSGVQGLVVLKTTDSEFHTFYTDRYTTLAETTDRVMATEVTAQWWHADHPADWNAAHASAIATMTSAFAGHHSLALQQTLYEMGTQVLGAQPGVGEIRFSLPNKHHFLLDLSPFGLKNPGEVFHADDRPYGLIEGTVRRDDTPDPGPAFDPGQGW